MGYILSEMKKHIIIILCIIQNILFCNSLSGKENYLFRQLSTQEGFPASIHTIYAEEKGFLWFGSKNGLSRYDGYSLKTYKCDDKEKNAIPGENIFQIIEDSLNNIWILTDQGTVKYNREKDSFDAIRQPDTDENIIATSACSTKEGLVLITTNNLYFYNSTSEKITKETKIENKRIFFHELMVWDENTVLCSNKWNGIFLLDINTGKFRPSPLGKYDREISRIFIDSKNRVWTTSYNKGIICLNKNGETIHTYSTRNSSLSHDVILCMAEHKGKIWAGTDGGGINIIDPETNQIKTLVHIPGDKNSLPVNTIQYIFHNKSSDICWAGSVKGGAIIIRESFIESYTDVPLNTDNGLTEKAVLSFYQEPESEDIWIGTDGGGINRFNPSTLKFKHYPTTLHRREKIVSICRFNKSELLVSIFSKGIFTFNKYTGELRPIDYNIPEISKLALYGRKSISLYQDDPSSVIIIGPSIYRYYFNSREVCKISPDDINVGAQTVCIGHDSLYIYLHDTRSIYAIDRKANKLSTIYTIKDENEITSVSKDNKGNLWVGSNIGVTCFNTISGNETTDESLSINNIFAMACDNSNRVWIGTSEHLYVWITEKDKLVSWDESDGAIPNEYLNKAVLTSREGDIYMGGINGMMRISPDRYKSYIPKQSDISLTDVTCKDRSILSAVDSEKRELYLHTDDNSIIIRIMAHEENILRNKVYKWNISGVNQQVIETNIPEISIRELLPGRCRISASYSTQDTRWSPTTHLITLIVPPAWYQSWWFITLCTIVVAATIIIVIINILRRKEEKMELAIKEHKQKIYEEKVRFLININHELRTPLTLIHTPINHLLKEVEQDSSMYHTLKSMQKQSQRMKKMLNMVLNLRKMEMTSVQLNTALYPLNEWIKEVGNDFNYEIKEKEVTIKYELDNNISTVEFDKEKHLIIITNLIINALKHSPQGSTITIRTETTGNGDSVRISVSDEGCGLKGVDMNSLFTRFYQGKNEKEGSGIGLSYAKILVELHHGHISAGNNDNGGACFYYEIPVRQNGIVHDASIKDYLNKETLTGETSDNDIKDHQPENSIDTNKYSCLFVDDNEDIRNLAIDTLKDSFMNIYTASNGKEALDIALKEIPDIIISDIMMPQMNGYELCKKVKENMNINHIQVILLTARIDEQSHVDAYRVGADAYIEKPFETSVLLETVKNRLYLRDIIRKRYMLSEVNKEPESHLKSTDDTFLFKLNKIIIEHMADEELNINYICQEIGMSRASLYNKLKPLTDMSPNEYINKIRMEKAMEMIKGSDMSMTEIAEKIGFSSSRYFSTAFKKYTGITPSEYKEGKNQEPA